MTDRIHEAITAADLFHDHHPLSGDCSSVTEGLRRVFGGHLEAISSIPHEQYFDHTVLVIDEMVYDGRGRVTRTLIEEMFVPDSNWEDDAHWFNVDDIPEDAMYRESVASSVVQTVGSTADDAFYEEK